MAARYVIRRSGTQYHWNLFAPNSEVILTSELYTTKEAASAGIESCRVHSPHDHNYERLIATSGEPYFVLRASNSRVIGTSQRYSSPAAREVGISACKQHGPTAPVIDQT